MHHGDKTGTISIKQQMANVYEQDGGKARHTVRSIGWQNLTLILLVQNFMNSLHAGKLGAYLHVSTYVSPTLLLTILSLRRETMRPTITPRFNAQSIDQRIILFLSRETVTTMEHLTARTGLGGKRVLLSVDRLSRAGKVSLALVKPFECRVSLTEPVR